MNPHSATKKSVNHEIDKVNANIVDKYKHKHYKKQEGGTQSFELGLAPLQAMVLLPFQ